MEVSGQLHAPAAVPHGKQPCYPMNRRLGKPQSWSGRFGENNNLLHQLQIEASSLSHVILNYESKLLLLNEVTISIIIIYQAPTDHNLATKAHMFELISKTLKRKISVFQCDSNSRTWQSEIKYTLYWRENKDNKTVTQIH